MGNWTDGVYCFFVHRSAKTATSDAETVTAQTDAARLKALDQLATANTESAHLRELNERFVRELRYAYETTPISRCIYVFNIHRTPNSRVNTLTQGLAQGDAKRGDRRQRRQRQGCGHRDADGRRQRPKRAAEGPQLKVHQGAESRQANQRRYRCRCREAQRSRRRHGTSLGVQSIPPLLLPYPSRNNRIPKYHPNSTTTSLTNHPRELQVSAARVENMQLKALHEQLTAELCAAQKATAAAETAAEKRAVAGAEAAKMASQDNARLRDVNVELVKALKTAQKVSLF